MWSRTLIVAIVILTLIPLAGCLAAGDEIEPTFRPDNSVEETSATGADLIGDEWQLLTLNGASPIAGIDITLTFDGELVGGSAGCNHFGGHYTAGDDGSFAISEIESTAAACIEPDGVMDQESTFFRALQAATWFEIIDAKLEIENVDGDLILVFSRDDQSASDLVDDSEWIMKSMNGDAPLPGTNITLELLQGTASGYAGCNGYFGSYTAGSDGSFTLGELANTEQGCQEPAGVMEQEELYLSMFREAARYELVDGRLRIQTTIDENILVFEPREELTMDPADLIGVEWILVEVDGLTLVAGSTITLSFVDGISYSGDAGCRTYEGNYSASDDDIAFSFISMSERACPDLDTYLEQEAEYTDALGLATHYRIEGDLLEFFTADGRTMSFRSATPVDGGDALEGTGWNLVTFIENEMAKSLLNGTEIKAHFRGGEIRGDAGCNEYWGSYVVTANSAVLIRDLAKTEVACLSPQGVMEQENDYLDLLQQSGSYTVDGDRLILSTEDGRGLIFSGG